MPQSNTKRIIFVWIQVVAFLLCLVYYCHDWYIEDSTGIESIQYERLAADCKFHLFFYPNNPNLHRERGYDLVRQAYVTFPSSQPKKHEALLHKAVQEYWKAINLDPNDAKTCFTLADLYVEEWQNYRIAHYLFQKSVTRNPSSAEYQRRLAVSYFALGQTKLAKAHLAIAERLEKPVQRVKDTR